MLRATRHRRLIDLIRRARRPITADRLAERLEVTVRTIYRDVSALVSDGVPIRGEAGVGYLMDSGYDMPPLMFTADELEALMLGARMVVARADKETAQAADDVINKIRAAIPAALEPVLVDAPLYAAPDRRRRAEHFESSELRRALREEKKADIEYSDELGRETARTIWPLSIGYFENRRIIVAWCELRSDFRHFRTDRIKRLEKKDTPLPRRRALLLAEWREKQLVRYRRLLVKEPDYLKS